MSIKSFSIGSLVKCRGREWVVLPSDEKDTILLRPLIGSEDEACGIYLPLALDEIEPASFPLPSPEDVGDFESCKLLWNAARFNLRSGAGPFRCMGRLSVRPRPYQIVPLLMALRLDPMCILIADDVGIGKTIEAALIARELLDRGEEKRLAVLCPPYLCDQWQVELKEKFHIDAVVIRSGTVARLDRLLPGGDVSVFDYFPYIIVSIDYAKMPRRRDIFLQGCPRLVIVDEAHSCSLPRGRKAGSPQHQRYELLRSLARDEKKHLILLTATPHSGIEESFRSLLGFLKPSFAGSGDGAPGSMHRGSGIVHRSARTTRGDSGGGRGSSGSCTEDSDRNRSGSGSRGGDSGDCRDDSGLGEIKPSELAPHFIQRRRADVEKWLGEKSPFPSRLTEERVYALSEPYKKLYNDVYDFAREMVQTGEDVTSYRCRVRYWAALSLLRCVTSSPASAEAALARKIEHEESDLFDSSSSDETVDSTRDGGIDSGSDFNEEEEASFRSGVMDPSPEDEETVEDISPGYIIKEALEKRGLRKLREFEKRAASLKGSSDNKVKVAADVAGELLRDGFHPIVYCRFIATSDYVADELKKSLRSSFPDVQVISVTSSLTDDERRIRVSELAEGKCYLLVATDCLSEGINLQEHFDAVVHYDLPWNPNRLEQREGRVDRFGQSRPEVRTVLIHGKDNPIDGAVLDVLIRKAREIRKRLGISVPIPLSSESVMEAVLHALLFKGQVDQQMELFIGGKISTESFYKMWDEEAKRYERVRRQFTHEQIKPGEVSKALQETDAVLGDKNAVKEFVISACKRLDAIVEKKRYWDIDMAKLPHFVRDRLHDAYEYGLLSGEIGKKGGRFASSRFMKVCFDYPAASGAEVIGRNHPLTNALAEYVFESAIEASVVDDGAQEAAGDALAASRCGVIKTDAVDRRTTVILLRLRYEIARSGGPSSFAEECVVCGFKDAGGKVSGRNSLKGPSDDAANDSSSLEPHVDNKANEDESIKWLSDDAANDSRSLKGLRGEGPNEGGSIKRLGDDQVMHILNHAKPKANVSMDQKKMVLEDALKFIGAVDEDLNAIAEKRASSLKDSHIRVRSFLSKGSVEIKPVKPLDVLGVYVLLPV